MAEEISVMYQQRLTDAWYQLSENEQSDFISKLFAINDDLGVEMVIVCESGWSNDEWQYAGVDRYPSLEALQEQYKRYNELSMPRYIYRKSILGTLWSRS